MRVNHKSTGFTYTTIYHRFEILYTFSAGVGRTGTFIGLDFLYEQGCAGGIVNVKGGVNSLRQQRVNMVQTKVTTTSLLFLVNKHELLVQCMASYTMRCLL